MHPIDIWKINKARDSQMLLKIQATKRKPLCFKVVVWNIIIDYTFDDGKLMIHLLKNPTFQIEIPTIYFSINHGESKHSCECSTHIVLRGINTKRCINSMWVVDRLYGQDTTEEEERELIFIRDMIYKQEGT